MSSLPQTVAESAVREVGKQVMIKLQQHGMETLKEAGKKALTGGSFEEGFRLTLKNVGDSATSILLAGDGKFKVIMVREYFSGGTKVAENAVNAVKNTASVNVIGTIILSGLIGAAVIGAAVTLFRLARANGEA